jgi:hypothetical protein
MRQDAHRNPSRYRNIFALATCCSLLCRSWSMHMRLRLHRPPVVRLLLMKLMRCSRLSRGPCGGQLLRVLQLLQRVGTPSRCCMLLSWCGWRRCAHLARARDCFRHSMSVNSCAWSVLVADRAFLLQLHDLCVTGIVTSQF